MLDGVRGLAVVAVMIVHMKIPYLQWGYLGVDVFFTLSGFLITTILVQEWAVTGSINFGNFYARRALRLLPALSVLLIVTLLPLNPIAFPERLKSAGIALFYSANWVRAFAPDFNLSALAHTWSLSVEEQFYLLWPIALVGLLRWCSSAKRLMLIIMLAMLASIACRAILWESGAGAMRLYNGLDTRADSLLAGCLLSLMLSLGVLKPGFKPKPVATLLSAIVAIPGLLLVFRAEWNDGYMFLAGYTLMALGSAALIFLAVSPGSGVLKSLLLFRPLVWIGSVSYGVYLWHYPIFAYFEGLALPRAIKVSGMWGAVFAVAALSYYGLERPFLRMKRRFQKQP